MSLNRWEQTLWDYWTVQVDERRFWEAKVASRSARGAIDVRMLAEELREYAWERAMQVQSMDIFSQQGKVPASSLMNLAEYLVRIWSVVPPKKKTASAVADPEGSRHPQRRD